MTAPAPITYDESCVDVDGRSVRYLKAGEGDLLVWLHHGGGLFPSAGTDLLTDSFQVLAPELPGFGSSADQRSPSGFDELSEQVAATLQALGPTRYVLHGTSFGGAVALHLALNHPDRVMRLILESPSAFRPLGWTPPDLETVRRGMFRHPERARRMQTDPEIQRRDRELVNRLSTTVDRDALAARLESLTVPTLVIFGDSDVLVPPELASMYTENAPDCASVLIPDAAHFVGSDQPERYADAVRGFATSGRVSV